MEILFCKKALLGNSITDAIVFMNSPTLVHDLVEIGAQTNPHALAVTYKSEHRTYIQILKEIDRFSNTLLETGLQKNDRVGIYLPKQIEVITTLFATSKAGGVFVPINPALKGRQVQHILSDCTIRYLVTSAIWLNTLNEYIAAYPHLEVIFLVDSEQCGQPAALNITCINWHSAKIGSPCRQNPTIPDTDLAAIFYTSGSTGKPKGVMLSHRNIVFGAHSVSQYLGNSSADKILAVLPFSFDYGFSQITTAFLSGAHLVLIEYLLPNDILKTIKNENITGFAAVPSLWNQLITLDWSIEASASLRYITSSGDTMPKAVLDVLREKLPTAKIYLMYGLTEAFRSTYLPPEQLNNRPTSIGKAVPYAEVAVLREDGSPCDPNEPGELVHKGPLVSLGYWGDTLKTKERFRPIPKAAAGPLSDKIAVWSGDTVTQDEAGYLYFVGRADEIIKTSGYRVSPAEIEAVLYESKLVENAVVVGVPHPQIGSAIIAATTASNADVKNSQELLKICRANLPNYMVPHAIEWKDSLPRNLNGKFDRALLASQYKSYFQ